jgi:hypothetical protein
MARYIDADEFLKSMIAKFKCVPLVGVTKYIYGEECFEGEILDAIIKETPTADVVEVKHGEWVAYECEESYGDGIGEKATKWYKCSECGTDALGRCYEDEYYSYPLRTNYCPNCGADMRGKTNG